MSGTTDMTSWDLGQQEEDLENSKFRERAFHESIYWIYRVPSCYFRMWAGAIKCLFNLMQKFLTPSKFVLWKMLQLVLIFCVLVNF